MNPLYVFALAILLGFETCYIVLSHHYRRQITQLKSEWEWERRERRLLESGMRLVER
ncbi:hypothetical protein [Saccharopolyspora sp. NPDC002376]